MDSHASDTAVVARAADVTEAAAGGGRNRDTAPVRVAKSPVATPASASTSVLSAPAPAAATTAVSAPAAASVDQEMPAGRTRRRRSAAV